MIKKKGKKGKASGKKSSAKKNSVKRKEKEKDAAEVREELVKLVKEAAPEMLKAVIGEGKKGQVSPVKYLLDQVRIFPVPEGEVDARKKYEECLAETLLDRLGLPKTPVVAELYAKGEEEEIVLLPAKKEVSAESEDEVEDSGEASVPGTPADSSSVCDSE